ncbi:MAG: hypothetical protein GC134_02005 [Proteobacteria bacterium]|nr:hypothetical protein [Pseudomonadota bacterium]
MFRHDQGCYKCGGHPGHRTKDRAVLYQCTQCGFYVCNQHRIGIGANTCPNCKSKKFRTAMSRNTSMNKKSGGMPSSGGFTASKKWGMKPKDNQTVDIDDDYQESDGGGGGGFGAGGGNNKGSKSQGAVLASDKENTQVKVARKEEVFTKQNNTQYISAEQAGKLPEGVRDRYVIQAPYMKDNGVDMMTLSDVDMEGKSYVLVRGPAGSAEDDVKNMANRPPQSLAEMEADEEQPEKGKFIGQSALGIAAIEFSPAAPKDARQSELEGLSLKASVTIVDGEGDEDDLPEIAVKMALRAGGSSTVSSQSLDDESKIKEPEEEPEEEDDDSDPYEGLDLEMLSLVKDKQNAVPKMIFSDVYFRLTLPESITKYEAFMKARSKQDKPDDNIQMAVISFDPRRLVLFDQIIGLLKKWPQVFGAAGYGPQTVNSLPATALDDLRKLVRKNAKIIAIGDVGLDLHFSPHTVDKQVDLMVAQIKIAAELGMPVYLSAKKADDVFAAVLDDLKNQGIVFHGIFSSVIESKKVLEAILKHQLYVAIRPEVSHEEQETYRNYLKHVHPSRLLLASGFEHTAPFTHRGWWNEPAFIEETARHAAKLYNVKPEIMATQACKNFAKLLFADRDDTIPAQDSGNK